MSFQIIGKLNNTVAEVEANTLAQNSVFYPTPMYQVVQRGDFLVGGSASVTGISNSPWFSWRHSLSKQMVIWDIKLGVTIKGTINSGARSFSLFVARDFSKNTRILSSLMTPDKGFSRVDQGKLRGNMDVLTGQIVDGPIQDTSLSIDFVGQTFTYFTNIGGPVFMASSNGDTGVYSTLIQVGTRTLDANPLGTITFGQIPTQAMTATSFHSHPKSIFIASDYPLIIDPGMGLELQATMPDLTNDSTFQLTLAFRWQELPIGTYN